MRQGQPKIPRPIWPTNDKDMDKPRHVQLVSHKMFGWCTCAILVAGLVFVFLFR